MLQELFYTDMLYSGIISYNFNATTRQTASKNNAGEIVFMSALKRYANFSCVVAVMFYVIEECDYVDISKRELI